MAEELTYSRPVDTPTTPQRVSRDDAAFLKIARERFSQAQDAEKQQRQRELDDLRFYAGDQWDDAIRTARAGQNASNGLPPVPARPCLTINKTREPVRQVLNQERNSDMGLELIPADDFAELGVTIPDTEIQLREGLIRRIQRESGANDARTWAFSRAATAGRGYYRVLTQFVSPRSFDQEIVVERIFNQSSVTLDPNHEKPDGSDAEWGFIGTYLPYEDYKHQFPTVAGKANALADCDDEEFKSLGEQYPEWFTTDGETRACRVVEYFYTKKTTRRLCLLPDGSSVYEDDLPDEVKPVDTREVIEPSIQWCKLDATQILDETDWPGRYIPIIKVIGDELHPYDKERRTEGMVRSARDAQRSFNYMVSKWVEMVGLAPLPPWQIAEGQIEGYEAWYDLSTTRTLPYLPYKTRDLEGNQVSAPVRTNVEMPIGPIAASVQMFDEAIQATTGVHDPSVGKTDPSLRSGKAIAQIVQQGQQATSNYMDNLSRSIRYEGMIINDLLYPIYNRPGRLARIINGQGEAETRILHQPMVMQDGRPLPAPVPVPPNAQTFTLTKDANFNVAIKVTKAYDTRRQEEAQILGELIAAAPPLLQVVGDLYFKNMDGPGHREMAERMKVMLDPKVQSMLTGGPQGGIPPQVQQQMQQAGMQMQALQQELQKAQQTIQADQIKTQAQLQMEQVKAEKEILLQKMKDATSIAVAQIAAQAKGMIAATEAENEQIALQQTHLHEANMGRQQMAAQQQQQTVQAQSQQAMQQAQHAHEFASAQASQQTAPEEAPEPSGMEEPE